MQPFSLSVAQVEMLRGEDCAATGTAFFYKHQESHYLITNWHNMTGVNAVTGQALHKMGMLPTSMRVHYKQSVEDGGKQYVKSNHITIPLYSNEKPVWIEHSLREKIDVAAIKLDLDAFEGFANRPVNEIEQEPRLSLEAGMECFILGFPEGIIGPAITSIWKRGSVASEPFDGRAYYYVDSATRTGMSGAPVIGRHSGFISFGGKPVSGDSVIGTVEKFMGIYSGRVGDDALGYQLGLVWKANVLEDVLTGNTVGQHPLGTPT